MAEKLKIISLGGLNEIGKNLTVYEYGGDIIIIDVGMGFPDDDMYGIDVVIPDFTYLIKNRDRIRGIFLTHGHEDHIGSIPYLLRDVNVPIYATRMTAGLVKLKLEEHRLLSKTKLITCEAGEVVKAGKFSVEFIHVNHSIADACGFAIKCAVGTVVHTGDFKIDPTPIQGGMMDLGRLGQLGKEGVLALLADSTNVERPGFTKSERTWSAPASPRASAAWATPLTPCSGAASSASSSPPSPPTWTASSRSSTWRPGTAARWRSPAGAWRTPCGCPPSWGI